MERKTRRKFSAAFKAQVVIEVLKERSTLEELARKYELHPNQITYWKKEFLENAAVAFGNGSDRGATEQKKLDEEKDKLYAQIGQLG